jgi:hypothetical protein
MADRNRTPDPFPLNLSAVDFPNLLQRHRDEYPRTASLEAQGRKLAEGDFAPAMVEDFVIAVCTWGGYAGIARRVLNQNDPSDLEAAFREALTFCAQDN